jgi:16S rRNA (cytosine967-C5)-methyltransferase
MVKSTLPGLSLRAGHDPRIAALSVLHAVLCAGEDSQAALNRHLASREMVPADKSLCTELAYGALRAYNSLREDVYALLDDPDGLPLEMRLRLCLAWYELDRLRVPPHAAINQAVRHIRERFGQRLAGVANGVLRSLLRRRKAEGAARTGPSAGDETSLARRHAMPPWIVRLWTEQYGTESALAFLAASSGRPPSGLRLNSAASGWTERLRELVDSARPENAPLRVGPAGLAYPGALPGQARQLLAEGRASRQSAASYQALFALDPASWPSPIWDACAGRGGKTLALLEAGIPVALASDPSAARLRALRAEYARLAPKADLPVLLPLSVEQGSLPPSAENPGREKPLAPFPEKLPELFGSILVDAPCSGLGTLARRPEIRLRRVPEQLSKLAAVQRAILEAAWPRLRPGGQLIYLTCTLNKAENEEQIAAFLLRHAQAARIDEFNTPASSVLGEFFYAARLLKIKESLPPSGE